MTRTCVAVIGGGIAGLCTALSIARRGVRVALFERHQIGGSHGGSGSTSRIIRSTYSDPEYVRLMQGIIEESWPELESLVGEQLIFPTPGVFFGRGPNWKKYTNAVAQHGVPVEEIEPDVARARFPRFRFAEAESILLDRSAGAIAAARTIQALRMALGKLGVEIHEDTQLLRVLPSPQSLILETNRGEFNSDSVVLSAGAWLADLLPSFANKIAPIHQTVAYYRLEGDEMNARLPNFPVWCWIGETENDFFYGLPELDRQGVKIGLHQTAGEAEDPNQPTPDRLDAIEAFVKKEWTGHPVRIDMERCLYAMTSDEDFMLGTLPSERRIVIASACSGHGFKFGPWVGEIAADLAVDGTCRRECYRAMERRFIHRLEGE